VASSIVWTTITAAAKRRHMVAGSPSTIFYTVGFIVSRTIAATIVVSVSVSAIRQDAACREARQSPYYDDAY
jgi:hypothetical protein